MNYRTHFLRLDQLLEQYQWLWRYQAFKDQTLIWPKPLPTLYHALLSLTDSKLETLQSPNALHRWAAQYIPELNEFTDLFEALENPNDEHQPNTTRPNEQLTRGISYRKLEQIQRFSYMANEKNQLTQWADWCSGKGHLAKQLNHTSDYPVICIEIDPKLCQQGADWAQKYGKDIRFYQQDILTINTEQIIELKAHHAHHCALHACGDLHIRFLEQAVQNSWQQLSLAPCCYQKTSADIYKPLSEIAQTSILQLSKTDLALAVQETATAKPRETKQRIALNEFRLGFDELQKTIHHHNHYLPLPSTSVKWLEKRFEAFCYSMAELKAIKLPSKIDFELYLALGKQRYTKVRRLELARQCFRRPLELWLLFDRALYLEQHSYKVELNCFCHRKVSARNVFIHASKKTLN